jgi:hypothetical protein
MCLALLYRTIFLAILMSFMCPEPCGRSFPTSKGLRQHQLKCSVFSDEDPSQFVDAVAKFQAKQARKRQKIAHVETPDIPPTGLDDYGAGPSGLLQVSISVNFH